ncbi:hypothetical protein CEXT_314961 [Caerostris extrusa]|uniref:Uncharacterized protein n=1 Tax=Caerostris extrusa TaxID=172846 RepID=A0AAV4S671_CAEEX|nr:hypothetical protein CEXT_314961 [Caerostris extrusa]
MSELQILKTHRNDTGTYSCSAVSDIGTDEAMIQYIVQEHLIPLLTSTLSTLPVAWVTLQEVKHDGKQSCDREV